ncbi:WGR domain-containing protein, partial [Escherichia coli]|uniref:WGR domain-containing protein n=5 Tax=Escherichia coli TaxID=562 RepID=UPI001F4A720B
MKKRFIYHDEKSNKFWWIDYEGDSLAVNYGKVGSIGKFQTKEFDNEELNRPGFPGECFICELRLPDHRFRWKH